MKYQTLLHYWIKKASSSKMLFLIHHKDTYTVYVVYNCATTGLWVPYNGRHHYAMALANRWEGRAALELLPYCTSILTFQLSLFICHPIAPNMHQDTYLSLWSTGTPSCPCPISDKQPPAAAHSCTPSLQRPFTSYFPVSEARPPYFLSASVYPISQDAPPPTVSWWWMTTGHLTDS